MYAPSITVDDVIDALADYLAPYVSGAEIVRAQVNRVPLPAGPCVVLRELLTVPLRMSAMTQRGEEADILSARRMDVQVDFYGDAAGEQCASVAATFATLAGSDTFPASVRPLYTSDPMQMPTVSGEQQYLSRWMLTASLQYNPVVSVPRTSAANVGDVTINSPADL